MRFTNNCWLNGWLAGLTAKAAVNTSHSTRFASSDTPGSRVSVWIAVTLAPLLMGSQPDCLSIGQSPNKACKPMPVFPGNVAFKNICTFSFWQI
jgi:hypothetical protein